MVNRSCRRGTMISKVRGRASQQILNQHGPSSSTQGHRACSHDEESLALDLPDVTRQAMPVIGRTSHDSPVATAGIRSDPSAGEEGGCQ